MKVEAHRTAFFRWTCTLRMGGRMCGEMEFLRMRRGGSITVDGQTFTVRREGFFSREWSLWQGSSLLAVAKKTFWTSQFSLELGGVRFDLQRSSIFSRGFEVMQGARTVGRLDRAGWFSRNMTGQLPDDWAPQHRAFVMWLVMMAWRRRSRAMSANHGAPGGL